MFSNILNAIINNMQHIKSLKDVPDLSLTEDVKKEMEKVIHNIYIEYQAFMETNMPKYNIFFIDFIAENLLISPRKFL